MRGKKLLVPLAAILVAAIFYACARDYVTGKKTISLVSESQEIAMGREADPQIVSEYGLYSDEALSEYVNRIGQEIAQVSHRPNLKYTFRVVDSPVVNAFALPGGWVYFTRGILAHFNSEDELAGVMGHEVGHVVARHGAEAQTRGQLAQLGLGVGSILSPQVAQLSEAAAQGIGILFLKYGRDQESESDRLGVEYSTRLGYDAHKMAGFFRTIARISEGGEALPSFLSTHPDPGGREVTVNRLATESQAQGEYKPRNTDRSDYLRRVDGIVFGDDPRGGFVEGNVFYHPELRVQFPVPKDWFVLNRPQTVQLVAPEKNAVVQVTLEKAVSAGAAAETFAKNSGAQVLRSEARKVNGMSAARVESNVQNQNQALRVLSYFIQREQNVFAFHGFTSSQLFSQFANSFEAVMTGFDQIRNQAMLSKKPMRVRIERVRQSADFATVLRSFNMPNDKMKDLAILNGMTPEDRLATGSLVKILRE
jgi:predicted Zn-dependent protease